MNGTGALLAWIPAAQSGWRVRLCLFALALFCFAACAPAPTPASLQNTPGPAVVVAGSTFTTDHFAVDFPDGWRIVTGPADFPQTATFVSPDNCALILIAVGDAEPVTSRDCGDIAFQTIQQDVQVGATTIAAAGSAPADQWETFQIIFDQVVASLRESPQR